MTATDIARSLHGRKSGAGYIARCLVHDDRTPSLSIRDSGDGRVLVHCFSGCRQQDLIEALRARGLWPEQEQRTNSPDERRASRTARRVQHESRYFARAAAVLVDKLLDEIDYPGRIALFDLRRDLRNCPMTTYLEWSERYPRLTRALVSASRRSDARLQRRLAAWLVMELNHAA